MAQFLRIILTLIITLFVTTSCQNCSDTNCKQCTNSAICEICNTNYILIGSKCSPCNNVFPNCNVCNDTVLPLQCVSCIKDFYTNIGFTACDTCSNLIKSCAQCSYQAPFQQVQCSQCIENFNLSEDKYSCMESTNTTVIIIVAVGAAVIILGLSGFFLRRWLKKKKLENPLYQEEDYQKTG